MAFFTLMPLVLRPPTRFVGSMSTTFAPSRAATMDAAMPQGTHPYTTMSAALRWMMQIKQARNSDFMVD